MTQLDTRFRGFLPVVIDVETGGFRAETDALLEVAAITLCFEGNSLVLDAEYHAHIAPEPGLDISQEALDFNGIDPHHPFRFAETESDAIKSLFSFIRKAQKKANCQRSVLVGHNAWFDLSFINAATQRQKIKRSPLHSFTSFDTATLSGLAYGQTVLARACQTAKIPFEASEAHSAIYDARKTAELFCRIVNQWERLGGWPLIK